VALLLAAVLLLAGAALCQAALPPGFTDHGIAAPVGMSAWGGTVATANADGRRLVFIKLWAGGNSTYLFVDAETGKTEQVPPGEGLSGLGAYLVFLSPQNKVYDTMGSWLLEIDVPTRKIRRVGQIPSGMALSFTMDPEGVIYAGIYPSAALVSYDPKANKFTNHGPIHQEDWPLYLRPLALDDAGWIYGGIAIKAAQVVGFNLATGEKRAYIPADQRQQGAGSVFRGTDGKVYANAPGWGYHALHAGECTPVEKPGAAQPVVRPQSQFPDGTRLAKVDVNGRSMQIMDAGADKPREVKFDYASPGVNIYSMALGPDGNIWGATGLPLRIWRFDSQTGKMANWGLGGHGGHVNQMVRQGSKLYGGVYSSGSLIELDPMQPVDDAPLGKSANPKEVHGAEFGFGGKPDMFGRPHALLAHPDGRHVLIGGNPARARVGGGLLIYDTQTGAKTPLLPDSLVPDQGVDAMAALPDGDLIIGSTIEAATGGRTTATAAMLYRLDWETRRVTDRWTLDPVTNAVRDLVVGRTGLVYGLAGSDRFFVFDPQAGRFRHDEKVTAYGPTTGMQAPRTMAVGPDGAILVLFRNAIARFDPETFAHTEIARPGVPITAGIVLVGHRLYFASGTRLLSYDLAAL
jgi:streptogramin lyase